ncbi:Activated CDC42 kinase 1 [Bagarius yarrelli]|uniref:non-specific protein-tyrosine kinase n=1 Tax=Bagarius yarrelli TaxID=175774 RepID=A0A556TYX5_BAGYA|nr:Activated CDC42 kinase 1 [Bagarius yarrelli]
MMDPDTQLLYQLLTEVQLERFFLKLREELNVTRIEHLDYVKDADLEQIGIKKPGQRRLWEAVKRFKVNMRPRSWMSKVFTGRGQDGGDQSGGGMPSPGPDTVRALTCLIQDSELVFGEKLGSGSFGVVKKAEWHTPTGQVVQVAVKTLRASMTREADLITDFLQEVTIMLSLDHPNIIRLYGVVLTQPLKMVTELASLGSLYNMLRTWRGNYPLTRLWMFSIQIAAGMEYLESRHFIHRDLAARNVLLASEELILFRVEREGERLPRPIDCPQELYSVMRKCWACNPSDRPTFTQLTTLVAEAKPMELFAVRDFAEARKLALRVNDSITVIEHGLDLCEWKGQNQRTLSIGWFPPTLTTLPPSTGLLSPNSGAGFISSPVRGSLQHTGHGDFNPERSWGMLERINEDQGNNGNFFPRTNERKHTSSALGPDTRRFSDASASNLPPRPPPPNFKRTKHQNMICDRRVAGNPAPASWFLPPSHPNMQFPAQQQARGATNLTKMAHLAKSSPQLDIDMDMEKEKEKEKERGKERERVRERYPPQQIQVDKENLRSQVQAAVHGVTDEQVLKALQRNDWNPVMAEHQLKAEQLYHMSQCSREECYKILARYKWDLQQASCYVIRMATERRTDRP